MPDKYNGHAGIISLKERINKENNVDSLMKLVKDLYYSQRSDYKENKYAEKENFYDYLEKNVKTKKIKKVNKLATKYQNGWKIFDGEYETAIKLAENFLKDDPQEAYFEVSLTLADLYQLTGKNNKAEKILIDLVPTNENEKEYISIIKNGLDNSANNNLVKENEDIEQSSAIVDEFALFANYPNPFNPTTKIKYNLPFNSNVEATIYDIMGREVKSFSDISKTSGSYELEWNGTNNYGEKVSSGIYLLKFNAKSIEGNNQNFTKTMKLMLLK